ncbi:MAG TPA: ATP-binding protein [Usitatibacter sp.]|nr:ATP-binding protein [Usitatibacter sp.]
MRRSAELATIALLVGNAADRGLLAQFLEESGHAVLLGGATSHESLVSCDSIIVDEAWARRGAEALYQLRRDARPLHLPVLLLRSSQFAGAKWQSGCDDVLHMPIAKEELLARVNAFVRIRRGSERAEAESEERFRTTLDRAPIGIAHCTLDGRFLRVNRTLCQTLKRAERELQRMLLSDLTSEADMPAALTVHPTVDGQPQRVEYEARHVQPDGAVIWLRISTWPVIDSTRESRYLVAIVEDITVRREAEARLAAANAELECHVAQRTAELRAANEELQAFTASVSHDLRAPVRAIQGFTDLLVREGGPVLEGRVGHLVLRLRSAADRMGGMIDGLLDLSRASRVSLQNAPVDLSAIARDVLDELATQAPQRIVETVVQDDLNCRGDPVLLRMVIDNLVGNAWKYTGAKKCARIEVGESHGPMGREFYVRDDGAGFDPAHAGRLFQPFERIHTESEFPGVGIGLATVRRIVQRHGGDIRAESLPDRGATFYVRLPAV